MDVTSFEDLGLDEATLKAVAVKGFETPSPIQALAIPRLLNGGTNLIAKARTGTGKTAAFGLPLVQTIREKSGNVQALILAPTRELAMQVCREIESFSAGGFPRIAAVYGGASIGPQLKALRRGVEIVVGTPGRVKDHLKRGSLNIDNISYFVLDEADEMLDMGFIDDIKEIFSRANSASRILLFSATMPKPILEIAREFMGDYDIVEEEERPEEPLLTEQKYWVVREQEKLEALVRLIDMSPDFYGLVFTQTKADADRVSRQLDERGYEAAAMHGDIPQAQREKILSRFRVKKTRILVATDVAARGIDIEGLTHVVNYSLPFDGPTYVHRIGRTGRAGSKGLAFTLVSPSDRRRLESLKHTAKKATKGELTEAKIPSVKEVLGTKKDRLFTELRESLGIENDKDSDVIDCNEDIVKTTVLPKVDETFVALATELCEIHDAKDVLAAVLEKSMGRALDASRYGEITQINARRERENKAGFLRVYVQLGRRDGYYPKEIANYFSQLMNIPQRMVDQIDVATNFSLVSLPERVAKEAIDRSKQDRSMPHMHLDDRASSVSRFGGRRSFGGRSSSYRGGRGSSSRYEGRGDGDRRNSRRREKGSVPGTGRKPRSSNASLYKK